MSDGNDVKLRALLPMKVPQARDTISEELKLHSGVAGSVWNFVGEEAVDAIRDALDADLFETLAKGWCKARELQQYKDTPSNETVIVRLGKHDFPATVPIQVKTMIGPAPGPTLDFFLDITAHFRSVALSIRGGSIRSIDSGDCSVGAQLRLNKIKLHTEVDSPKVQLPGRIEFKHGLQIGSS